MSFLKTDSKEQVAKTIKEISSKIKARNEYIKQNHEKLSRSDNWKKQKGLEDAIAWENRMAKNQANRRKLFSLPTAIYNSNPEYWSKVVRSKKLMRQHPEFMVKQNW